MSEDEFFMMLLITIALTLCVVRLVYVNRKLKKKVAVLEAGATAALAPHPVGPQQPQRSPEIDELRQRVHVLERIATDGNPLLRHEIEALRHL